MFNFSRLYLVRRFNIERNMWEDFGSAPTLDAAFDMAEKLVGASKIHDTIEILDQRGDVVWSSDSPVRVKPDELVGKDGSC